MRALEVISQNVARLMRLANTRELALCGEPRTAGRGRSLSALILTPALLLQFQRVRNKRLSVEQL